MRLRPLTGQVLVEILPSDKLTAGGIEIPEYSRSPEDRPSTPQPPKPLTGIVRAVGHWKRLKNGLMMLPEVQLGQKVLVAPYSGQNMQRGFGDHYKMVSCKDVLAVLS